MVAIPAWVWRFPRFVRALIAGPAVGVVIGLLALLGSNSAVAGTAAFVAASLLYSAVMARRMAKFWPGAKDLSGPDRVAVTRAVRGGHDIDTARLAQPAIDYSHGLHEAADRRFWWWAIVVLGVVALGTAVADTIFSPPREAVVSWLYFAFFPVEVWWWPRRQARLLANAQRAADSARRLLVAPNREQQG